METIHKIAYPAVDEKIRARFKLLRENKNTYEFLIGLLKEFTKVPTAGIIPTQLVSLMHVWEQARGKVILYLR